MHRIIETAAGAVGRLVRLLPTRARAAKAFWVLVLTVLFVAMFELMGATFVAYAGYLGVAATPRVAGVFRHHVGIIMYAILALSKENATYLLGVAEKALEIAKELHERVVRPAVGTWRERKPCVGIGTWFARRFIDPVRAKLWPPPAPPAA